MANEITELIYLKIEKDELNLSSHLTQAGATQRYDLTGTSGAKWTQSFLHSADSAIVVPTDVGTVNRMHIENLDTANKVTLSLATGGSFAASSFADIDAGKKMVFKPLGTVYIKATTATVKLQITAIPA